MCYIQSRAEISSSQLEPRYHGYIARRYTYYNSDPYFSRLVSSKIAIAKSLLGLWGTFLFLNLLIPLLSITRRKQVIQWLTKATAASNPRLYRAIVLVLFLFNIIYILSVVVLHSVNGYPTATNCHISWSRERCRVPPTSTSYKHIFAILITKAITLPIALLIELAVAVYSVIKDSYLRPRIKQCIQIMVTWQLLIFVHITMGLISIPFLVLAFISPATVLLSTAGIVLVLLLIIFIFTFSPIPKRCNFTVLLQSCLSMVEILLIVAFVFSAFITYYTIVKDGLNMSGVKGYITSLIPTIVISLFVWMLRKGFLGKQLNSMKGKRKKTERHRTKSFSSETEDETINLLSTTSN